MAEDLHRWLTFRVAALGDELRRVGYTTMAPPVDPEQRVVAEYLDHLRDVRFSHRSAQTVLNGGDTSARLAHDAPDTEKLARRIESLSSSWRGLVRFLAAEVGIEARLLDEADNLDEGEDWLEHRGPAA